MKNKKLKKTDPRRFELASKAILVIISKKPYATEGDAHEAVARGALKYADALLRLLNE